MAGWIIGQFRVVLLSVPSRFLGTQISCTIKNSDYDNSYGFLFRRFLC
jgi:hypothetical protein